MRCYCPRRKEGCDKCGRALLIAKGLAKEDKPMVPCSSADELLAWLGIKEDEREAREAS